MRVVICGAGIAGLTLAWWLSRDGHDVVVLERSKALRGEGYMIDFFGSGWDVAERMGLLGRLSEIHYPIPELVFLHSDGRPRVRVPYPRLRKLFDDRHFNFMRGDLESVLFEALADSVEVRFGATIETVQQDAGGVDLALDDGAPLRADLLVGADGIHSRVRELVYATESRLLRPLGFDTAAYIIEDPALAERYAGAFRTLTVPGRQAAIYPIRGGKLATFFVHDAARTPCGVGPGQALRVVYGDLGWVVPELLQRLPPDDAIYFDSVSQVVLDAWSRDRVTLVGDACQAVSLLAGQGASMAMGGAWALAQALRKEPSVPEALVAYQAKVQPAIVVKQQAGRKMARWFVPSRRWRIVTRDLALWASAKPGLGAVVKGSIAGESIVD